ncbi:MAG: hypothetical protein PQJ59_04800 [Spirochaetales bacterium]|nr:hypothetical protein [Spirochaetales bacterium]
MAKSLDNEMKEFFSGRSYSDLVQIKKTVTKEIEDFLNDRLKIGTVVTVETKDNSKTKGNSREETKIYGITEDYYILKEGETVLKKKYTFDDFLTIDGMEV